MTTRRNDGGAGSLDELEAMIGGFDETQSRSPIIHSFSKADSNLSISLRKLWLALTYHWKQLSLQKLVSIAGLSFIFLSALVIMSGVVSPGKDLDKMSTLARPPQLQNGIIYENDQSSILFENAIIYKPVILEGGEGVAVVPPELCVDKKFRCAFYWTSETRNGRNVATTKYCTAFVCKGMAVRVTTRPQTCSGNNKVGITKLDHDVYYSAPLAYSCSNTGCGECSSAALISSNHATLAFIQACTGNDACYGEIEVSITKAVVPSTLIGKKGPGGQSIPKQYQQGAANPKFLYSPGNRGKFSNLVTDFSVNWQHKILLGFRSTAAVDNAGMIFIGSDDTKVYAISSLSGELKWTYSTDGKVFSSPCLSSDGSLYVGSDDKHLHSINAQTGIKKWSFPTLGKVHASPVIGFDGLIYIGSSDGIFYAVKSSGSLAWAFNVRNGNVYNQKELAVYISEVTSTASNQASSSTAAVVGNCVQSFPADCNAILSTAAVATIDNSVIFGCENGYLYVLNPEGRMRFSFKADGAILSSPSISTKFDSVYFGADDGYVYSVSLATGQLLWKFQVHNIVRSAIAIDSDGTLYVATDTKHNHNHRYRQSSASTSLATPNPTAAVPTGNLGESSAIFALHPSGAMKWQFPLKSGTLSSPALSNDGFVYIGTDDHTLLALYSSTGRIKETFKTDCKIAGSAVITSDGNLVIGTWQSGANSACSLYSFGKTTHHNQQDVETITQPTVYASVHEQSLNSSGDVWECSERVFDKQDQYIDEVEAICDGLSTGKVTAKHCVPGLAEFVGRGIDISFDITDIDFWKKRVIVFRSIGSSTVSVGGIDFISASNDEIRVTSDGTVQKTHPFLSGIFSSVSDFSAYRANYLRLLERQKLFEFPKVPFRTANSYLVNSTAIQSDDVSEVSEAAKHNKYVAVNIATKNIAHFSIVPSPSDSENGAERRIKCGSLFSERLAQLPDDYKPQVYLSVIEDFGTHVVIGGTAGGSIMSLTSVSSCQLEGEFPSLQEAFASFSSAMGGFVVESDDPSRDVFDSTIERDDLEVCGGNEKIIRGGGASVWRTWVDSLTAPTGPHKRPNKPCFVDPDLIPIWMFVPRNRPAVRNHLAVSVIRYLQEVSLRSIKEDSLNMRSRVKACSKRP